MSENPIFRQAQRDLELGRLELAIYDWLRDRLDFVVFRPLKVAEIEMVVQRSKEPVVRALAKLTERGYLERGPREYSRGPFAYRLRGLATAPTPPVSPSDGGSGFGMLSPGVEW